MLFPPSRCTRRARASLLLPRVLICVILAVVGASMPAKKCPDHIECARRGRHFCKPGSGDCGPCLIPLEEDEMGHCVARSIRYTAHSYDTVAPLSGIDEEIDLLSSVISKQQLSESKQSDSGPQSAPQLQSKQKSLQKTTTVKPMTTSPTTPTQTTNSSNRHGPIIFPNPSRDSLLVLMISLCIIVGAMALILVTVCWVRLQRETRLAQKVDYPAFQEAANRNHTSSGDKTLAHSAQMYHYQHQKQQMLSMEKHKAEPKVSESGGHSDEETEEGDFTVYECPGLAPTGEMEVKNPLFDDSTLHSQKNHK